MGACMLRCGRPVGHWAPHHLIAFSPAPLLPLPHQMTGGVGDYYIPEEEQPVGVRVARGFWQRIYDAWEATPDKPRVL